MRGLRAIAIIVTACGCCENLYAVEVGRLFTTAEERSTLDRPPGKVANPVRRAIPVQGVIQRRGGEVTVWMDDRPLRRGDAGNGFVLLDGEGEEALILRDAASLAPESPDEVGTGDAP